MFFQFHMEPSVEGGLKIYTNGHGASVKMAAMPIYGKHTFCFLQNQESFKDKSIYIASETQGLPSLLK